MGSCWYLEHVSTRDRIVLNNGENLIGRHSSCKITVNPSYEFVSRVHVKMTVSDAGVIVQSMNTSNGVFINEQKLKDQATTRQVFAGTVISLGVEGHMTKVPRNYPIFVLRKVVTEVEQIELSSDDDDDEPTSLQNRSLGQWVWDSIKRDTTDQDGQPSSTNLHLPKIPDVKQEMVSKTTEEITNIFGTADEAILGSVMDLNPYLYNQLNKQSRGTAATSAKIHDGDVIELDTDADNEGMQPLPLAKPLETVDDEYDEQFAISQAVLQGMKAEMAFSDGEEDFLSSNIMEGSPSAQMNYDEIIVIDESDDDELYDKVADWSNKLLSQKGPEAVKMSQAYPLTEDLGSDQEADSRFGKKKLPRSLYIDSSSEDESNNLDLCNADSTTNSSRLSCPQRVAREEISIDDAQLFSRRQRVVPQADQENRAPDSTSISGTPKSSLSKPKPSKNYKKETLSDKVEEPKLLRSTRLRNRSKSFYMERPIGIDETHDTKDINEKQNNTRAKQQSKLIKEAGDSREKLVVTLHAPEEKKKTPGEKTKPQTRRNTIIDSSDEGEVMAEEPPKNGRKRLRNRAKSFYMERPIGIDETLDSKDMNEKQNNTRAKQQSKLIKEAEDSREKLVVTLHAPEEKKKTKVKKTKPPTKHKIIDSSDEGEVTAEEPPKNGRKKLRNRSKSFYMERPIGIEETLDSKDINEKKNNTRAKQQSKPIKEAGDSHEKLVVTLHAPEEIKKTPVKKSKPRTRRKTIGSSDEGEVMAEEPPKNGRRTSPRLHNQDKPAKEDQTKTQNRSARLLNRSRSCYMERPIDMDESLSSKRRNEDIKQTETPTSKRQKSREKDYEKKAPSKKPEGNKSNKSNNSREEVQEKAKVSKSNRNSVTPRKEGIVENAAPVKKGPSPRLLSRSKSCFIDDTDNIFKTKPSNRNSVTPRKEDIVENAAPVKKGPSPRLQSRSKSCFIDDTDNIFKTKPSSEFRSDARGPSIIEAPFMSKNRCKVNIKDKQRVIDRQRFIDFQTEMNAKWKQKPKDKKKDDQEIKEKRREALKKLTDKPKDKENSPSTSNANKRKSCTSVPTVSNTNRGEFLTKGIDSGPPAKIAKKNSPPVKKSIPKRRSTIEIDDLSNYPQPHCFRPPERKEAEQARNQRTCNRVNFADMERYHQRAEEAKKMEIQRRHVRFTDEKDIKLIDRVCGANKPVRKSKDSLKICLSTYIERREWTLKGNTMRNDILYHKRTILMWANQWLKHGSVDAIAKTDALMPIPSDFTGYQHYRKIFSPLIKLELLTTIERDYKSSRTTLNFEVIDVKSEKEYYRISAKTYARPIGKFELYTLSSGTDLPETFASLLEQKSVGGNVCFMTFEIWMQVSFEKMKSLKQLFVRPVVDSLRVELGTLSAIQQLHRSPLSRRILMPSESVKTLPIPKVAQAFAYTGFTRLNNHQEDICIRIYKRIIDNGNPSVTLVQGPPGTGKSVLLSNLSLQCLYGKASVMLDRKILICAHSNTAVDNMVKALSNALFAMNRDQFQLLRFGMLEKMCENSRQFSVSSHLRKARNDKLKRLTPEHIEMLKKQHCDLSAEIEKLKQKSNLKTTYLQQQLEQNQKQLLLISEQLNPPLTQREEFEITKMCMKRAHIVCTTLSSCIKLANYVDFFDICIIDEATQCTEPWTLLPMRFGIKHLVLVGDTQQLPAVVLSKKAVNLGFGNSMFDRIQKSLLKNLNVDQPGGNQLVHTKLFKLSMQYRMHPEICRWPNKYFYEDQLVSADKTARPSPFIPYCVINLSYTRDTGGTSGNRSISNDEEARFVAQLLAEMDKHMSSKRFSYGLISPYHNQCHALSQVIPRHMNLTPQTVDSYQGLERDVIIISNARTRGSGFLAHYQRLNLALTRPKRCLIICGNFGDLESVDMWRQLLDDARQRRIFFDLKRDDVNDLQSSLMKKILL